MLEILQIYWSSGKLQGGKEGIEGCKGGGRWLCNAMTGIHKRNGVFATSSDFLIPISLQLRSYTLDISNYEFC